MHFSFPRSQQRLFQLFSFAAKWSETGNFECHLLMMMVLDWEPPGNGSKTEWQDTYSLIVCELKPGLVLHGALAQVNGWGAETEWDMKRAIELVTWVVWLCNHKFVCLSFFLSIFQFLLWSQLCKPTLMNRAGRQCVVFQNNKPGVNAMQRAGDVLISVTAPLFC